ncbi:hypothetical protein OG21DRAFT_1527978, partial [Imleria badia]
MLFLDDINNDCNDFKEEWNCHPIQVSGPDTNNKSLKDLRFLGQTSLGIYHDDCEGLSYNVIEEHYGIDGPERVCQPHQSGAGNPMDKEDIPGAENQFEATMIACQGQMHKAVPVQPAGSLFHNDERATQFYTVLQEAITCKITPENFGLAYSKWEDGCYPVYKTIL